MVDKMPEKGLYQPTTLSKKFLVAVLAKCLAK